MRLQSESDEERRLCRRVLSLVPAEDDVLIGIDAERQLPGKLIDISFSGALIEVTDASFSENINELSKLYFQSRGQMFVLDGKLVRKETGLVAFGFINLVEEDLATIRTKLARMEILAARLRDREKSRE